MDLKDFIVSALTDIVEGASEADSRLYELGGEVNPRYVHGDGRPPVWNDYEVRFSVTVRENESATGRRGLGVVLGATGIGALRQRGSGSDKEARLEFSVRIGLPPSRLYRAGQEGRH